MAANSKPMSAPELSVLICTHNPRADYYNRVLAALRAQTLPRERWELLVIDNGSAVPVQAEGARVICEPQLGVTHARIRGIAESTAELIVFNDDDNLLAPDYLERALEIAQQWPMLGTWGGQAIPEWEEAPADWTRGYWNWFGVRTFIERTWSNMPDSMATHPFGAGMCVRRQVAEAYQQALAADPRRRALGRTGKQLIGSEDADVCFTAADLGLGNGLFPELVLTHLIARHRVQEDYLLRLIEALTFSHSLLLHLRGAPPVEPSWMRRLLALYEARFLEPRSRAFAVARQRGLAAAARSIHKDSKTSSLPPRALERVADLPSADGVPLNSAAAGTAARHAD